MTTRLIVYGKSRSGTTITREILSQCPNMFITHEMRLYEGVFRFEKDRDYFTYLSNRLLSGHNSRRKWKIDPNRFISLCMSLSGPKRLDWIKAVESVLFNGLIAFGDKTGFPFLSTTLGPKELDTLNMKYNKVYIHRDGRDVVASGVRHVNSSGDLHASWVSKNVYKSSLAWRNSVASWLEYSKGNKDCFTLRFEDYKSDKKRSSFLLSKATGVQENVILQSINDSIKESQSHIGYYPEHIPDWKSSFHPLAIEMLETLNYT